MKSLAERLTGNPLSDKAEQCDDHGEYLSRHIARDIFTKCPECTKIEQAETEEKDHQEKLDRAQRDWMLRLDGAGIPKRFMERTLESYHATSQGQQQALRLATRYADNFTEALKNGSGLVMSGKPGTGKTHLAVGIGVQAMRNHHSLVHFTSVMRLVRSIKDSWADPSATESEIIKLYVKPDLLILDEVGVQIGSEFERNMIFDVINERYKEMRPTILISNLPKTGVIEYLGERVYDRMREGGGYIPFDWESYRGKAA